MSRSEVPFAEVVAAVRAEIAEAQPNGWQVAYGLIRRIGDRVQFDAAAAGSDWRQRSAEGKFGGQVSRAFGKLADQGVLRKAAAGKPGPDGREVHRHQVAYYTPQMWDAIAEQHQQAIAAEQTVLKRSDRLCARLEALGIIARQQPDGELRMDLAGWERLLSMQEAGLILRGLPAHVRFAHPDAGYDGDRDRAARHLIPGRVYVLCEYHVGGSHSTVQLAEVPGLPFNAVQFEPATHEEYEGQE